MRIITISREFGSGGRELGKRIADELGFDYYDSEIVSAVARENNLDADYVEKNLDEHGWQKYPVTYRCSIGSSMYTQNHKVHLLLAQKHVLEEIAALGKDCVIVGRNADLILQDYQPFRIFVCADMETKMQRCKERTAENENFTDKELKKKIKQIDKMRAQTREMLSGTAWGQRDTYNLTVNTSGWNIKELASAVSVFAVRWFGRKE